MEQTGCSKPNRLAREKSLYLRQHACNPVDWWPWGREALEEARRRDKPLFISIGYSTCHWCHVMARESFSDPTVAEVLNRVFINIKVDREERPDVDSYYMAYCQIASGSCGWPLTVLATPDGKPFYVATYLPRDRLVELALSVERMWREAREDIEEVAHRAGEMIKISYTPKPGDPRPETVDRAYERIASAFDWEYGGVGVAPKFPTPHLYRFLIRYSYWRRVEAGLDMATLTATSILMRGIWDHVGGGLHRYSTDRYWHLPHFEKMLYDQATFLELLVDLWRVTGDELYYNAMARLYRFLKEEMESPGGGFYSAIDSESGGVEGLYYTYTVKEVEEALGDMARLAIEVFGLRREGNYRDEATGRTTGRNIIYTAVTPEELARKKGITVEEARRLIDSMLEALKRYREEHKPRPQVDTKILTSWSSMMITSLARLGRATGWREPIESAVRAYNLIMSKLWDGDRLLHVYNEGEVSVEAGLEDYAHLARASVELYQALQDPRYLEDAIRIAGIIMDRFWTGGRLVNYPPGSESPMAGTPAEAYDASYPSPVAATAMLLHSLYKITGEPEYGEVLSKLLKGLWSTIEEAPAGYASILHTYINKLDPGPEVVISSPRPGRDPVEDELAKTYTPDLVVLRIDPSTRDRMRRLAPYTANMIPVNGETTYYVCRNHVCSLPTTDPRRAMEIIRGGPAS